MHGHLSVLVDHGDAQPVIHLSGDLDLGSSDQLIACVEQLHARGHEAAILDLGRVGLLDSSGVRALVQAGELLTITMRNPSVHIAELLSATGLDGPLDHPV